MENNQEFKSASPDAKSQKTFDIKAYERAYRESHKDAQKVKRKAYFDGRKELKREYDKLYRRRNREKKLQQGRAYYVANKKEILAKQKLFYEANKSKVLERNRKWAAQNKDRVRSMNKLYRRANDQKIRLYFSVRARYRKYRLTKEVLDTMIAKQGNRCYICEKQFIPMHLPGIQGKMHVDHCHRCNGIRSLLCHSCNVGIGSLCEDIHLLKKALAYLLGAKRT